MRCLILGLLMPVTCPVSPGAAARSWGRGSPGVAARYARCIACPATALAIDGQAGDPEGCAEDLDERRARNGSMSEAGRQPHCRWPMTHGGTQERAPRWLGGASDRPSDERSRDCMYQARWLGPPLRCALVSVPNAREQYVSGRGDSDDDQRNVRPVLGPRALYQLNGWA